MITRRWWALIAVVMLIASGCSSTTTETGKLKVVVSFYPLGYVAGQVGGDLVQVTNLTTPGAEPHDLELSARQVADISQSDLVFYQSGFQPAVDEAIASAQPSRTLDAATLVALKPAADGSGKDPHAWLNPLNMGAYATGLAEQLAQADPDNADQYRANAQALVSQMTALDASFSAGLSGCRIKVFITSHSAFGYLADRYGLTQVAVALSPEEQPSPARIAEVQRAAAEYQVTTIFYETLTSPAVSQTIAEELGLKTDVLDPIEGVTDESRGTDYPSIMTSNLTALQTANGCS